MSETTMYIVIVMYGVVSTVLLFVLAWLDSLLYKRKRAKKQRERWYQECAYYVRQTGLQLGDERAMSCGYDLICGLAEGNVEERLRAWMRVLHGDRVILVRRNGMHVPQIEDGEVSDGSE